MTDFKDVQLSSMKIKVLGTGCAKCKSLEKLTQEVVQENNISASIEKVEDIMEIMAYNIMSTPALIINEEVMIKGKLPSKIEILEAIKKH